MCTYNYISSFELIYGTPNSDITELKSFKQTDAIVSFDQVCLSFLEILSNKKKLHD